MTAARDILRRLSVLGARVECRGNRLVLCTGRRVIPADLIEAARAAKPELLAMLGPASLAERLRPPAPGEGEHLRELIGQKPCISAAFAEDAQVSAFDRTKDFRGVEPGSASKVLTPPGPRARLRERPPTPHGGSAATVKHLTATRYFTPLTRPRASPGARLSTAGTWRKASAYRPICAPAAGDRSAVPKRST
jgi:hypothetical protein